MNSIACRFLLVAGFLFGCLPASAQPFLQHEIFNQAGVDSIDLNTSAVQLSFPVINKAGRGVSTSFAATYSGDFWVRAAGYWTKASYYGWNTDIFTIPGTYSESQTGQTVCKRATSQSPAMYVTTYGKRTWTDGNGVTHRFSGSYSESDCTGAITNYPAWSYADGYSVDSAANVYDPHGTPVNTTDRIDANGNIVTNLNNSSCSSAFGMGCFVDTTGAPTLASDGQSNRPFNVVHYYYLDSAGHKQTITVTFSPFTIRTNFGLAATSEYGPQQDSLPTSIAYPDGTYYLSYEPTPGYSGSVTGRIASLTLPTGSTIRYTYSGPNGVASDWGLNGSNSVPPSTVNRITTDGTISFTQSFPSASSSKTLVAYPSGRADSYSFSNVGQSTVLTGVSSQGQTTSICYSGSNNGAGQPYSCLTDGLYLPITARQVTNTLNNGLSRQTTESFNSSGLLTERDETDFSASTPSLVRKTLLSYNTSFVNKFDRVQQVTVQDGANNILSQATYSYDQNAPVQTSGLPNHTVPALPPGNRTQVSLYNSGGSALVTNYTVDDAGQIRSISGPGPGQTTLQYDGTDSYVTATYLPQVGTVTLSSGATTNAYTGELSSQSDANGRNTLYGYDASLRLTSTTNDSSTGGDGAVTTRTYNTSNQQIGTSRTIGNGSSTDVESFTDGYGRPVRLAQSAGQNTWTITDTCYDGDGRLGFRSLPYTASSLTPAAVCSGQGDSYSYDTYGRLQAVTHADNTQTAYAYLGRAVKVTDEGAGGVHNARAIQSDGLGRLTLVCEYSAGTGLIGSPAAVGCGTDINASGPDASATGYLTQYSYNLSNRSTTVSQSGAVRTWQNDSLDRLIYDQVPERAGATTFSYSYNTTGLQVLRSKAAPNQPWSTASPASVITTSQTDALGRPSTISYNDGVTPSVSYTYDSGLSSPQSHNMLGRLATATMGSNVQQFSYTSNGQIEWERSCLASTCAGGTPTFVLQTFLYNQLQQPTQAVDGAGNSIGYQYDSYGRLNNVSESAQSGVFPATLLSGFGYGPLGLTSVAYGNGLSGTYGFDTRGRSNSFHAKTGSQANIYGFDLVWGANGSLIHSADTQNDTWSYAYDEFSRLKTATTDSSSQGYSYQYDIWGNRWNQTLTAGSGYTVTNSFDAAHTNHINQWNYDAAGDVLWDGAHNYTYDPEGRILTVDGTTRYVYGPDGSRAQVIKSSGNRDYIYTPSGQLSSIWNAGSLVKANVYVGDNKLASYSGAGLSFEYSDWTGSTRVITNSAGAQTAAYSSLPFGMLAQTSTGSDLAQTSGLDWDSESQSGHAWARQYNPKSAAWLSPDPANDSYESANPQSFNRYAYVGNNPMSFSDPLGLARYTDAPDPDSPFGAFSDFYGNRNSQVTGCQPGDGDVCRGVRVIWDWLSSHLGGGVSSPYIGDGGFGFGRESASMIFQVSSHIVTPGGMAQQQNATTLKDKNGSTVQGANGNPALIPGGFNVNAVVQAGKDDKYMRSVAPMVGTADTASDLANFRRYGQWDLQRLSGNFDSRFIDSATILIGMYAAAAGLPRDQILSIENKVAIGSSYAKGTVFDSTYTHLPVRNVTNTDTGMRLVQSGAYVP